MGAQITLAGESLIAQKQGTKQVLDVTRCVFANVPGLNVTGPIDRAAGKPPAAQIVHTAAIPAGNKGYVNPNQVVYSIQLGSDVGDWEFNWIGLESAEGVLFAVAYVPLQQKRRNIPPQQIGNNITRNFLIVFDGAQGLTNITIDASTWQHDFTVRLHGVDERERLSNRDVYGRACFFGDGLRLEKVAGGYRVKPGLAYVEGIRVALGAALSFAPATYPTKVWLAVALRRELNDVVAQFGVYFGPQLDDYLDNDGTQVYCVPIAYLPDSANVADLRNSAPIAGPLVDHFAARVGYYPSLTAGAADKLKTPVTVNGVAFDGSGSIVVADSTKLPLAGGIMTGPVTYQIPQSEGSYVEWRARSAPLQLTCPNNEGAYMVWKATNYAEKHLAAMDVYSGGETGIARVVMHVGNVNNSFTFSEGGNLSVTGIYYGSGLGLTALNANVLVDGLVNPARLQGLYNIDISGYAARLSTPRAINGVAFDGSANITVADSTKLPLAGGIMTGPVTYQIPQSEGSYVEWRARSAPLQLTCPNNEGAYMVWKATNYAEKHLAAMDVYSGGATGIARIVMHVGNQDNSFTFSEGGNLSITGSFYGSGLGLTALSADVLTVGRVATARLSGLYNIDISGYAARLATPRAINGVPFDGTANITVADNTKLPLAGGTVTGPVKYEIPQSEGSLTEWRGRAPALQISCPNNNGAYQVWKATNFSQRHLAALDVFSGGDTNIARAVLHVGNYDNSFVFSEGGNLTIAGFYSGNGSGLKNLPPATPDVAGVVQKNTAQLGETGWWKCAQTGLIKQWGLILGSVDKVNFRSFPIAFPNACLNITATRTGNFYEDVATGTNAKIVSREQFAVISGPLTSPQWIYWEATGC